MNKTGLLTTALLSVILVFSAGSLSAQENQRAQPASRGTTAFGTIDTVMQDDGFIEIDGRRFTFRASQVTINYNGRTMRPSFLQAGLRVSYIALSDGNISSITLLGPVDVLEQIDNH